MPERDRQTFTEQLEVASHVDRLTFYAHDILADAAVFAALYHGCIAGVAREYKDNVVVDGVHYGLTVSEFGLPRGTGEHFVEDFGEISVERHPLMSTGGKFVVHTARWGINSLPDAEWVGRRVDGTNWFGRYKKGRLIEKSYPGALAGQEWIAKTLKATGKVEEDGLDGKA